ncbi:MAG: GNAT family N-acetyltransferase [Treponema sp.]|jgi:Leu/Phe-tRNA-protein transferase|nr:GNAT family N-acetyltransferase [Treponema sp.]
MYRLHYLPTGHVFLDPRDDCDKAADALIDTEYGEDFCLSLSFDPLFVAELMAAGFLVMSCRLEDLAGPDESETGTAEKFVLLPKHHLIRSCLFFPELYVKKSIKKHLPLYDLYFDRDFDLVLDKCIEIHGDGWLTPPLITAIREMQNIEESPARPVSFALYRKDKLVAGEFGIVCGRVYTSYSGYFEEDNAGTVQMIHTAAWLEKAGFSFWDLGMPLDYKLTLGAREISREDFYVLFREAQMGE